MQIPSTLILMATFLAGSGASTAKTQPSAGQIDPLLGRVVAQCRKGNGEKAVWIFKQWHLAPSTMTQDQNASGKLPQAKNQAALYQQLDRWVSSGFLKEIIVEGCSGELSQNSTTKFNGWDISSLKKETEKKSYASILSHIGLKLEAKHADKITTLCGDEDALVKEANLAFSDARGTLGFLSRLDQHKNNPARAQVYLEGAREAFGLPKSASYSEVERRLKQELKEAVTRIEASSEKRNRLAISKLKHATSRNVALLYGGSHGAGIKKLLEEEKLDCNIVEPIGYVDDEEELFKKLNAFTK
ncbi:MAG: hypothetical protein AB1540_13145 [Bdellovibrionota bacterium]